MPSDPMNPMPVQPGQAEPVHAEQPPVTASPSEAIDEAAAQQLVEIFRDDSDGPQEQAQGSGGPDEETCQDPPRCSARMTRKKPSEPGGMCHSAKLSRSAGRVPDPMLVKLAAENYGMKLDGLVGRGRSRRPWPSGWRSQVHRAQRPKSWPCRSRKAPAARHTSTG